MSVNKVEKMYLMTRALRNLRPESQYTIFDDGNFTIQWDSTDVTQPTTTELETEMESIRLAIPMERLREKRNALISETDWWANSDVTLTEERRAYRQALRDITNTYSSLDDVVWPTKPS